MGRKVFGLCFAVVGLGLFCPWGGGGGEGVHVLEGGLWGARGVGGWGG